MFRIQIEENLHLELLQMIHSQELFALVDQNREHLRQWLPWLDDSKSEEDTKGFIKRTMQQFADDLGCQVGIFFEGKMVGVCGFHPLDKKDRRGELGYWLSQEFEGRGFMTKTCARLIQIGFEQLDLNKISIRCATENCKSASIPERLGFVKEGTFRESEWLYDRFLDHYSYSQLRSEYLNSVDSDAQNK